MLSRFMTWLFGAEVSGKRQAGWVVFVTVTGLLAWMLYLQSTGTDMSPFVSLMVIAWPTAMGAAVGPHILEHLKPEL